MLIDFFYTLRAAKLPVSVKEYLMLLEALQAGVVGPRSSDGWSLDDFYFLARTTLVKDEKHYDKFDRAFAAYFKGVEMVTDFQKALPEEWLRKLLERELTPEQKAAIEKMDWDTLMETLKKRLEEQKERHEGGNKWIGTGGTSPFGHGGYNPQGVRIGGPGRNRSAVKVWEQRAYRDYDDTQELGTRNIKMAMRRLRKFARQGGELELDLPDTIRSTAANAGWLDIKLVPERHNNVKVLLLMDVVAPWTTTSSAWKSCFPPPRASSSTWSSITSTTASTTSCGRTTNAAFPRSSTPGTSFANTTRITS